MLLLFTTYTPPVDAFVEGLYCGVESCYDVLSLARDATKSQISKAYRKLARKYHPDVNTDPDGGKKFQQIATAYETLKDEEARKDYDYMLDNPEEAYYHYYQYYKRRVTPKVDVRIVLAVTISIISLLQFMNKNNRYEEAVRYAMQNPKFRNQALQIIHQEGLLEGKGSKGKSKNKRSKDEKKREEERVLREVVENSIDIKGGYSKAGINDTAWVQLIISPYTFYKWSAWYVRWTYKFRFMKQEYGDEEKEYLTYTNLGLTATYWDALDDDSKEGYMERELWVPDNLEEYQEEQEEEMRVKMAESGRHKMWRRYMKAGGPGNMTFGED